VRKLVTLGIALAALLVGASGCIDQTRAANEAIARANAKAEEYAAIDGEVTRLLDEATSVDFTPEGVQPALAKLDEARAKIEERQKVVSAMRTEFASISSLRVSDEVKQYAMTQVAIADLLAQADERALDLIDATKEFYERIVAKTADSPEGRALAERLMQASEEIESLSATIAQKRAEADAFFDERLSGAR
jgi:vacuolar-type H+-ATPase subunit I/STV1